MKNCRNKLVHSKFISKVFSRIEIQILLCATAKAFEKKGVCILFSRNPLKEYAFFTKKCMQTPVNSKRLYQVSYRIGKTIRRMIGFQNQEDLTRIVCFLYKNIGITMEGNIPGELSISNCYFSKLYSPKECSYMSSMDAGIVCGICGGGTLKFTERITEGCEKCIARVCLTKHAGKGTEGD